MFEKTDAATLRMKITKAVVDAIDANGAKLLPSECPRVLSDGSCAAPPLIASVAFEVRAYELGARRHFFAAGGGAYLMGRMENWELAALGTAGFAVPFWSEKNFGLLEGDNRVTRARVGLKKAFTVRVPLGRLDVGERFAVRLLVSAEAFSRRGRIDGRRIHPRSAGARARRGQDRGPARAAPLAVPGAAVRAEARAAVRLAARPGAVQRAGLRERGMAGHDGAGEADALGNAARRASVQLVSEDGSAEAGSDYRRRRITVPFGRRDRAPRLVRIPIVHDTAAEPEETLRLRLSGPRCVNLGPRDEAEVTIEDDDRGVEPGGFAIGGAVSGLLGSGLVLDNQGDRLQVAGNGPFQFAGRRADQAIYDVRVASQPTNPDQVCTVANGAGTVAGADVTNIGVNCVTAPPVAGLDPSFGGDGKVSTPSGSAEAVAVQPDGAIVTAGNDSLGLDFQLMRHQPDGDLDPSFGGGDGIVTTSFGGPLGAPLSRDEAFDVALQPDGKILVAGSAQLTGTSLDFVVARYNPDGSPDTGFGGGDGSSPPTSALAPMWPTAWRCSLTAGSCSPGTPGAARSRAGLRQRLRRRPLRARRRP